MDLVDLIWKNRPSLSKEPILILDQEYAGKPREDKIAAIREKMREEKVDLFLLTSLDEIAWLLNIRGNDVKCNPVVLSYLALSQDQVLLFVNQEVVSDEVKK